MNEPPRFKEPYQPPRGATGVMVVLAACIIGFLLSLAYAIPYAHLRWPLGLTAAMSFLLGLGCGLYLRRRM
jgi:hypothetical protein